MALELTPATHPVARLPKEWEETVREWGFPPYRGRQVFEWIHRHGVLDPEAMTNLPKAFRKRLVEDGLVAPLVVDRVHVSADDTQKLLVRMRDGEQVETVLIPQLPKFDADLDDMGVGSGPENARRVVTQCISSQVGCAMGCTFCASGVMGLKRQMTAAEIVTQVIVGRQRVAEGERIRNVVFMGMGEPLHNYDEVARALTLLTHPDGIALSQRRVTVSTSGLVRQIDRLGADFDGRIQLAVSLHATTNEARSSIMPINRKHDLTELIACLKRYPMPRRRRITIEYTLIDGVNDSDRAADELVRLLNGVPSKVNLIPMNPIDASELGAPAQQRVHAFRERLANKGLSAFVRKTRGDDVAAACGQLVFHGESRRARR